MRIWISKKARFLLLIAYFLSTIFVNIVFSKEFDIKNTLLEDLSRAHGFLKGQNCSIKKIILEFPSLKPRADQAVSKFNSAFGIAEKKIEIEIKKYLGKKYNAYLSKYIDPPCKKFKNQTINFELASSGILEIENRSIGKKVPPQILETLLMYQYKDAPENEFYKGFVKSFTTKGHAKAQGLDILLQYPISWLEKEGKRPHIISSFTSENGRGLETFNILVKKFPYSPTSDEISLLFTKQGMKEGLPSNCEYISSQKIVLESFNGGLVTAICKMKRLDIPLKMNMQMYIIMVKNKAIYLNFMSMANNKFESFKPLFKNIANSLIIQNKYY